MRIFNLTDGTVDYKGKSIRAYGSVDIDVQMIPDRDAALEKAGILAFGTLPVGWRRPEPELVEKKATTDVVVEEKLSLGLKELPKERNDSKKK